VSRLWTSTTILPHSPLFTLFVQVLRSLGFSIKPELPFVYLLNYLKALAATPNVAAAGMLRLLCLKPRHACLAFAFHPHALI